MNSSHKERDHLVEVVRVSTVEFLFVWFLESK